MPLPLSMSDNGLTPAPCLACRRRLQVNGKPVFKSCCCVALGRPVTVLSLTLGAVALGALAVSVARTPRDP